MEFHIAANECRSGSMLQLTAKAAPAQACARGVPAGRDMEQGAGGGFPV